MLNQTIDRAYQVFSGYRAVRPLDVCTACCMKVEDESSLASLPVREIPADLLRMYNDGAKPEKTRIEEVKHFMPRYLELISQFSFPSHSAELSLSRLTPFDRNEWTIDELELLTQFSREYFRHCLSIYPIPSFNDRIDTILIMLWRSGFEMTDLLLIWESESTKESVLHFRDLYFHGFDEYNPTKLSSAFGDEELAGILRAWMGKVSVKQKMADSIEQLVMEQKDTQDGDINELSLLYEMLILK